MLSWRSPLTTREDLFPESVIERNRQIDAEDRNCRNCLARLRDRTSVYCSTECRDRMADPNGAVDLPALLIPILIMRPEAIDAAAAC